MVNIKSETVNVTRTLMALWMNSDPYSKTYIYDVYSPACPLCSAIPQKLYMSSPADRKKERVPRLKTL